MKRELLLLCQGTADQELGKSGKRNAQKMGAWMASQRKLPDVVFAASSEPAKVTAEKACKAAGLNADLISSVDDTSSDRWIDQIGRISNEPIRVFLTDETPIAQRLLERLSGERSPIQEGSLAIVQFQNPWNEVADFTGTCVELVHADSLSATFPFPAPDGPERRLRPAYYYRQSSVIPYRHHESQLEVLLISSSSGKRWLVPKGIHEPGLSAQDSAAKEAFEEAGVRGDVLKEMVGSYQYEKWGSMCHVEVFPMQVSLVLPETEWAESHRNRKWVPAVEACNMVNNADLQKILAEFPKAIQKIDHAA